MEHFIKMIRQAINALVLLLAISFLTTLPAHAQIDEQEIRRLDWDCAIGDADACTTLGLYNDVGYAVPQNRREARRLMSRSCEGGNRYACLWSDTDEDRAYIAENYFVQNEFQIEITAPSDCGEDGYSYLEGFSQEFSSLDGVRFVDSFAMELLRLHDAQRTVGAPDGSDISDASWSLMLRSSLPFGVTDKDGWFCPDLMTRVFMDDLSFPTLDRLYVALDAWTANHQRADFQFSSFRPPGDRLYVVLEAQGDTIWTPPALTILRAIHNAMELVPGVYGESVRSLWSSAIQAIGPTPDGDIYVRNLATEFTAQGPWREDAITAVRERTTAGGYLGRLVGADQQSAIVYGELQLQPRGQTQCDLIERLTALLEEQDWPEGLTFRITTMGLESAVFQPVC